MLGAITENAAMSPPRIRLTRADCAVLEMAGRFDHQKVELIEGEPDQQDAKKPAARERANPAAKLAGAGIWLSVRCSRSAN